MYTQFATISQSNLFERERLQSESALLFMVRQEISYSFINHNEANEVSIFIINN